MNYELQKQHEDIEVFDMIEHLKMLYQEQAKCKRFVVSKVLFQIKLLEGSYVGTHVLKMIENVENLEQLGLPLESELDIDFVLQSYWKTSIIFS